MKNILFILLITISLFCNAQNKVIEIGGSSTAGNPVLSNVTAADTARWEQGGSMTVDQMNDNLKWRINCFICNIL